MKLLTKIKTVFTFFTVLQAALLFSFVIALTFFAHLHKLPNGQIIIHCHAVPTDNSSKAEHHDHSRVQFIGHSSVSHIELQSSNVELAFVILVLFALLLAPPFEPRLAVRLHTLANRAPPLTCLT